MKQICSILLFFLISAGSYAQNFADYFQNKTLRVDYIFTGNNKQQAIYLDELSQLPSWAGREHHLSELPLEGNGQIIVRDLATRQCIYKTSFSSLFQECPPMKPRKQPKASKIHSCFPTPNSRQR